MDHRVRLASVVFWAMFLINLLVGAYVILQYSMGSSIFGDIPLIFLAIVNAIVCLVAAIGMGVSESYRI